MEYIIFIGIWVYFAYVGTRAEGGHHLPTLVHILVTVVSLGLAYYFYSTGSLGFCGFVLILAGLSSSTFAEQKKMEGFASFSNWVSLAGFILFLWIAVPMVPKGYSWVKGKGSEAYTAVAEYWPWGDEGNEDMEQEGESTDLASIPPSHSQEPKSGEQEQPPGSGGGNSLEQLDLEGIRPTSKSSGQNSITEKQLKIGDVVGTYERKTLERTSRLVLKDNGEGHLLRVGGTADIPTYKWTIEGNEVYYHGLDGTFIFVYIRNSDKSLSHIANIYGDQPRRFKKEEVVIWKRIKSGEDQQGAEESTEDKAVREFKYLIQKILEHQKGLEKEWAKNEIARGAKPGGISFKTKYDIKKRDSIITPYIGIIEMTQTLRDFVPAGDSVCTVQLLYTDGKWTFGHAELADQQLFGGWERWKFEALTPENWRKSAGGFNLLSPLRWELIDKFKN